MSNLVNYIIPVCRNVAQDDCEDRLVNLNLVLQRFLSHQRGVKVRPIIVEQVLDGGKPWFLPRVKSPANLDTVKVAVYYHTFVKGWLYNIGARKALGQHLVFGEMDCLSTSFDFLARLLAYIPQVGSPWAIGWDQLYYTLQREKQEYIRSWDLGFYRNTGIRPKRLHAEGGMVYSTKAFWESMGGYSEWILELGGPDNDWAFRARFWTGRYPFCPRNPVYHLWHDHIIVKRRKTRMDNREKLQFMYDHSRLVCQGFRKLADKVGRKVPLCESINYWKWAKELR